MRHIHALYFQLHGRNWQGAPEDDPAAWVLAVSVNFLLFSHRGFLSREPGLAPIRHSTYWMQLPRQLLVTREAERADQLDCLCESSA